MARKRKEQNKEVNQQAYFAVDASLGLSAMQTINDKVKAIILAADDIQTKICQEADFIKIECYDRIAKEWPELGMSRKCWTDTVAMRRLQHNQNLSQTFIDKVKKLLDGGKNDTALRDAIIDGLQNNDEQMTVPSVEAAKNLQYDKAVVLDDEFLKMLDDCANTREHIDGVLYPMLAQYSQAFEYVTGETHKEFKVLLDMWHYRHGGWPSEKTPPRCWGAVARFRGLHDLLDRYGFDMFNDWVARFGMKVEYSMVTPAAFVWGYRSATASVLGKHLMFKLKDIAYDKYEHLGIKPWHHFIVIGNFAYAYVWDSREVQLQIPSTMIDLADITNEYVDSCEALLVNTADYNDPDMLDFVQQQEAAKAAANEDFNDFDDNDDDN